MKNENAAAVLRTTSPARIFARPTADDLWLGPAQESALRHLSAPAPVRVLLGPPSSGRTTLLRCLAHCTDGSIQTLSITGPQQSRIGVLQALLASAGLERDGLSRAEIRQLLSVFVREQFARARRVVVQIDDAATFSRAAFDEVWRLQQSSRIGNTAPEILLSLVHVDEASSPAADFVRRQQAPEVIVLSWLNQTEVSWYIRWRMQRFGLAETFSDSASQLIGRYTRGCYKAIDHVCQMALLLLRNRENKQVDVLLVREAIRALRRLHLNSNPEHASQKEAELIVSRDGELLHRIAVGERLLVGRSHLNDISLDCSYLSRHHVAIVRRATGYFLCDLNSYNGVLLNGNSVQSAPVGNGDVIRVGPYRLKVLIANEVQANPAEQKLDDLADTVVMPTPDIPEPAYHLKAIR